MISAVASPDRPAPRRVLVITASVGAGHDGPAREIAGRLRTAGHTVASVDLVDLAPWGLGRALRTLFRWQLMVAPQSWGRLFDALDGAGSRPPFVDPVIAAVARRLAALVLVQPVDVMVSTFPLGGLIVAAGRRHGLRAPLVTYVTDPAAHAVWVHETTSRYLVTVASAAADIRRHGRACVSVVRPAVRSDFRPAVDADERGRLRADLGLPPGRLVLLTSGSWGVGEVALSARELRHCGVTPVVVCGGNDQLRRALTAVPGVVAVGWTDRMPEYMRACDAVVLNSGGLTFAEAVATGLPVLHYRPLPGQGRANAAAGERSGLARWPRQFAELGPAVDAAISRADRVGPVAGMGSWNR